MIVDYSDRLADMLARSTGSAVEVELRDYGRQYAVAVEGREIKVPATGGISAIANRALTLLKTH